jgi:hypothetical protein
MPPALSTARSTGRLKWGATIIPRGIGALGYAIQRPTEDRYLMTRATFSPSPGPRAPPPEWVALDAGQPGRRAPR